MSSKKKKSLSITDKSKMPRIVKTAIFLMVFCFDSSTLLAPDSLPFFKRIMLSQKEELIARAFDFAVSSEENIFLSDTKLQKIMLFDRTGDFIKSWKMRGQGPGEYLGMSKINFKEPYLGILDRPGYKLVIYRFEKAQELEWVKNLQSGSQSLNNFQFYQNKVIFDGLIVDKSGQYFLQSKDLQEKHSFFLPAGVRFGQSPEKDVLSPGGHYAGFSAIWGIIEGFLDVYDDHVYSAWKGTSEIIKINMETKKWEVFKQKTKNYLQPEISRRISLKEKETGDHIRTVSWVKGVFADINMVGLIYLTYNWKQSCYIPYLQTFNKNGVFQKEDILEGANGDYPKDYFSVKYNRQTGRLYILLTIDNEKEDVRYEILSYQIRQ